MPQAGVGGVGGGWAATPGKTQGDHTSPMAMSGPGGPATPLRWEYPTPVTHPSLPDSLPDSLEDMVSPWGLPTPTRLGF